MKTCSLLQTPTTHQPDETSDFYRRLGFEQIESENLTRNGSVEPSSDKEEYFSDGKVLISANPDRSARTAIRLFGEWNSVLESLAEKTEITQVGQKYLCSDPNGVQVFLEPPADLAVSGVPVSVLGKFAGLSIETTDFPRSLDFWKTLGYQTGSGDEAQGWLTLEKEDSVGISLMKAGMCPHLFFNPGLTYFNSGKNLENIAKIREAGIAPTEEISCFNPEGLVDNVILRDPGRTGFFIFND